MTLVADENMMAAVIARLRADGHAVRSIHETDGGATDPAVLAASVVAGAILVTEDKDFGELVYHRGQAHCGVVLLRLAGMSPEGRAELVSRMLRDHAEALAGAFTVIAPGGVRIRRSN